MKFYILALVFFETNNILNIILLLFYTRKKIENFIYWINTLICPAFLTTKVCFLASKGLISIY